MKRMRDLSEIKNPLVRKALVVIATIIAYFALLVASLLVYIIEYLFYAVIDSVKCMCEESYGVMRELNDAIVIAWKGR